jgi:hypothetical protein
MKSVFRNVLFACLVSFCFPVTAHDVQNNPQAVVVMNQSPRMSDEHAGQSAYSEEAWLVASFLFSMTGLFIILRYLHRH